METVKYSNRKLAVLKAAKNGLKLEDAREVNWTTLGPIIEARELFYEPAAELYTLSPLGESALANMLGANVKELFVKYNPAARQDRITDKFTAAYKTGKLTPSVNGKSKKRAV